MNKNIGRFVLPYLLLLFFCVLALGKSPFFSGNVVGDDSVFTYIGRLINIGFLPYKDVFDHKGLLLYFIYSLGLSSSLGYMGVWLLEIFSLFISCVFISKTLRLFFDTYISFFSTLFSVCFFISLIDCNSGCEEWILPFESCGLYLFCCYVKCGNVFRIRNLIILSLCFVCSSLIKITSVAFFGAIGLSVIFVECNYKRYSNLFRYILIAFISSLLFYVPFFIFLFSKGILKESLIDSIIFNFSYPNSNCGSNNSFGSIFGRFMMELIAKGYLPFYCSLFLIYSILIKKLKGIYGGISIIIIITVLACCVGRVAAHYYILYFPLVSFSVAEILNAIKNNVEFRRWKLSCIYIFLFLFFNYGNIVDAKKEFVHGFRQYANAESEDENYDRFCSKIKKTTPPTDRILVLGNSVGIYLKADRLCSSKYPYIYPIIGMSDSIRNDFFKSIKSNPPKVIVKDWAWKELPVDVSDSLQKFLIKDYIIIAKDSIKGSLYETWLRE